MPFFLFDTVDQDIISGVAMPKINEFLYAAQTENGMRAALFQEEGIIPIFQASDGGFYWGQNEAIFSGSVTGTPPKHFTINPDDSWTEVVNSNLTYGPPSGPDYPANSIFMFATFSSSGARLAVVNNLDLKTVYINPDRVAFSMPDDIIKVQKCTGWWFVADKSQNTMIIDMSTLAIVAEPPTFATIGVSPNAKWCITKPSNNYLDPIEYFERSGGTWVSKGQLPGWLANYDRLVGGWNATSTHFFLPRGVGRHDQYVFDNNGYVSHQENKSFAPYDLISSVPSGDGLVMRYYDDYATFYVAGNIVAFEQIGTYYENVAWEVANYQPPQEWTASWNNNFRSDLSQWGRWIRSGPANYVAANGLGYLYEGFSPDYKFRVTHAPNFTIVSNAAAGLANAITMIDYDGTDLTPVNTTHVSGTNVFDFKFGNTGDYLSLHLDDKRMVIHVPSGTATPLSYSDPVSYLAWADDDSWFVLSRADKLHLYNVSGSTFTLDDTVTIPCGPVAVNGNDVVVAHGGTPGVSWLTKASGLQATTYNIMAEFPETPYCLYFVNSQRLVMQTSQGVVGSEDPDIIPIIRFDNGIVDIVEPLPTEEPDYPLTSNQWTYRYNANTTVDFSANGPFSTPVPDGTKEAEIMQDGGTFYTLFPTHSRYIEFPSALDDADIFANPIRPKVQVNISFTF